MNECPICLSPTKYVYCSLSCSNKARYNKNLEKYLLNPKRCLRCLNPIDYDKRFDNIYCSHSCSATISNVNRKKVTEKKLSKHSLKLLDFKQGLVSHRTTIRNLLIETVGNRCAICNMENQWQSKTLVFVVDHIDGNASNNMPTNLRLLCPNCNSQTDTFCGRNKGKGRGTRGLSLH